MLTATTTSSFIPVFARDILGVGAVGYGYLQAAPGAGAVIALLLLSFFTYYKRKTKLQAIFGIIMGICLIIFSMSSWLYFSLLLLIVFGGMQIGFTSLNTAVIQNAVTDNIRGRIMSWREIAFGLGPVVSILFGAIAQRTSVSVSLGLLGVISLIVSFLLIAFLSRFKKVE